jgi:predicted transcriptional regulator
MNRKVKEALDQWFDDFALALEGKPVQGQAVISLPAHVMARVLTERRCELLSILNKGRVCSISELAERTGRKVESVSRDLSLLSKWGFIRYEPRGKRKEPVAVARYALISLSSSRRKSPCRSSAHKSTVKSLSRTQIRMRSRTTYAK